MIVELNHDNFDATIAKGLVLVDFWAAWCGPCRLLSPTIDEIAREHPEAVIAKLNVDDHPEIASRNGVMSIPTIQYFVNGVLKDTSIGVVSKSVIEKKLDILTS